ncbi:MAG: hypothetical protein BWY15_02378 [Firmicutes bacterium ADurb.Bin193]|nr:MAG: hypothetical protein BWY15_02378 [Firmicutes bacterium ADurb.Bin193]
MDKYKTIEEILSSGFAQYGQKNIEKSDRVLRSTKIEQAIYEDLHNETESLSEYESAGGEKLKTFDSLVNDVFQSVYGLTPKFVDENAVSALSRRFNKSILEQLMSDDNYSAVKSVCEGKELPAIGATEEFTGQLLENLDVLMSKATGDNGKVDALSKMEQDIRELSQNFSELMKKREEMPEGHREPIDKKIVQTANRILSKQEQSEMYSHLIENCMKQNGADIKAMVSASAAKAKERAEGVQSAILAWGNGDAEMKKSPVNTEILRRTAMSDKLRYIAQFLGRYKQMLNSKRLAGFTYGRGEKYDIEYGNNISRVLTSELSYLSNLGLLPLFLKKHQNKQLKQYRRREQEYKGKGDIVVCLDESGSTFGENNAYGMAIAMVLYEICKVNKANFALVHFSTDTKVDYFPKNELAPAPKVLDCAETLLGGGTDFEKPLDEVVSLTATAKLDKADIVFITDGVCDISEEFLKRFERFKTDTGSKLTGILLDKGENFEFTLNKFADCIFRTSELLGETIVEKLIEERI